MGGPHGAKCDEKGMTGALKGAEDSSISVGTTPPASAYDILTLFPYIEGIGHCDMHKFKEWMEEERCGSRGPLPYNYPLMPIRRCDGVIDCPYEDVDAPPSMVDEGAHCMDHCK